MEKIHRAYLKSLRRYMKQEKVWIQAAKKEKSANKLLANFKAKHKGKNTAWSIRKLKALELKSDRAMHVNAQEMSRKNIYKQDAMKLLEKV